MWRNQKFHQVSNRFCSSGFIPVHLRPHENLFITLAHLDPVELPIFYGSSDDIQMEEVVISP